MNDWVHALTRPAKSLGLFPNLLACHISWMPAEEVGLLDQRQDIGAHSKAGSRQPGLPHSKGEKTSQTRYFRIRKVRAVTGVDGAGALMERTAPRGGEAVWGGTC